MMKKQRLILGVSGASGVILSYYLAKAIKEQETELHLVISDVARLTWELETEYPMSRLTDLADVCMKEGRKVVLCPRKMPLSKVHLRNILCDNFEQCCDR